MITPSPTPITDAAKAEVVLRKHDLSHPYTVEESFVPVATSEQLEIRAEHYKGLSKELLNTVAGLSFRGDLSLSEMLADFQKRFDEGEKL